MSEESIENITKSDSNFVPTFVDHYLLSDINFNRHCLISNFNTPKKIINKYISYTLNHWSRNLNIAFSLKMCLFGSAKLTEKVGPDKYKYSNYNIGFNSRSEFLFTDGSMGK